MEDDIREFCNMHLSYLIDDGFQIIVTKNSFLSHIDKSVYVIVNVLKDGSSIFKWEDVKDEIIPFLNVFGRNFKIQTNYIKLTTTKGIKGYLSRVIEDDVEMINMSITVYK